MANIQLQRLTPDSPHLMDAIAVYDEYIPSEMQYQEHFFRSHMRRAGYVGLVALYEAKVVGFVFGSDSLNGQWWHERVATHIGRSHPALQDAWVLTQLNVLADYRNQNIGLLLHNRILQLQTRPRVLLSTQVANKGAQRFYQRQGWQILHKGFHFSAGDEPYMIWHRPAILSD